MGRLDAPQFQDSYKKFVAQAEIPAPPGSGYLKLHGKVYYLPRHRRVKVFINGTKAKDNLGPPFSVTEGLNWTTSSSDFQAMRDHLNAKLQQVYRRLRDRDESLLSVDVYITKCNVTGKDEPTFMETVCSQCVCWYCELAGG